VNGARDQGLSTATPALALNIGCSHMAWLRIMLSFVLSVVLLLIVGAFSLVKANESHRALFLKAESLYHSHQTEKALALTQQLKNYPLYPYLALLQQQARIDAVTLTEVAHFEKKYPDFALTSDLRRQWLRFQAQKENWPAFLSGYTNQGDPDLLCANQLATHSVKKKLSFEKITPIWLNGNSVGSSCERLFKWHAMQPHFNKNELWDRFAAALKKNNLPLQNDLLTLFNSAEKHDVILWKKAILSPSSLLKSTSLLPHDAGMAKTALRYIVVRVANKDPKLAIDLLTQYEKKLPFQYQDTIQMYQAIGLALSSKNSDQALLWLNKIKQSERNEKVQEWRVRLALKEGKWTDVLSNLLNMNLTLSENPRWQYWKARALAQLGKPLQSNAVYESLAKENNYYGYLASLNLAHPPVPKPAPKAKEMSVLSLENRAIYQRIKEWRAVKKRFVAKREWDFATRDYTDPELVAAAKLAYSWGWIDEAIRTSNRIQHLTDFKLKFPTPHKAHILGAAKARTLDPALIYSLTRQESLFFSEAKSGAGAFGLMQLMPRTAKEVALKQQIPLRRVDELNNPSTNIALGTAYLSKLMQSTSHPVLATASYNAGPHRVREWLPEKNMPADIWIEIMPYDETRDYVKNVMSFSVAYDYLLGNESQFAQRLKVIPGVTVPQLTANP